MNTKQIAKEAGNSGLATLETVGGFMAANAVSKLAKVNSLMATIVLIIAGVGIATFSKQMGKGYVFEKLIPNAATGFAAYGTIKTLNVLSGDVVDPGVKGLNGFSLPDPAKQILREWVPNLSGSASFSGTMNGMPVEMTQLADGSWGLKGLGNPYPLYMPELAGLPYQVQSNSSEAQMLDLQIV